MLYASNPYYLHYIFFTWLMNSFIFRSLSKEYFLTLPVQVRVFDGPLCFMEREHVYLFT